MDNALLCTLFGTNKNRIMEGKPVFTLSEDYKVALDTMEKTKQNVFITGRAGTGKSTLLKLFDQTTKKKTVLLAPTGVAALNIGGQTVHSFFRFPGKMIDQKDIKRQRNPKLYKALEVIVIDEISMVRADLLDNIDYFLRLNRNNPDPFGGVQMIFFGDLFQLPPVVASAAEKQFFQTVYDSPYFFSAKVFQQGFHLEMIELRQVYRQNNRYFLRLLEGIRMNQIDYDDLDEINERYDPNFKEAEHYITLSARNATVNAINTKKLDEIPFPAQIYSAKIEGEFNPKLYPTDSALSLKLGAQVMFIKNDPEGHFVNGTIGQIVKLDGHDIKVKVVDGQGKTRQIEVKKLTWEILRYKMSLDNQDKIETETIGKFTQYPLKLAWAITIHKSQGKTFDKVIIDLGKGAFEFGQTYVAFSRCRTLEGIVLRQKLKPRDIMTDEQIIDYYEAQLS